MACLAVTCAAVGACVALAVFRSPWWLGAGAVVGVVGFTISRRTRVP